MAIGRCRGASGAGSGPGERGGRVGTISRSYRAIVHIRRGRDTVGVAGNYTWPSPGSHVGALCRQSQSGCGRVFRYLASARMAPNDRRNASEGCRRALGGPDRGADVPDDVDGGVGQLAGGPYHAGWTGRRTGFRPLHDWSSMVRIGFAHSGATVTGSLASAGPVARRRRSGRSDSARKKVDRGGLYFRGGGGFSGGPTWPVDDFLLRPRIWWHAVADCRVYRLGNSHGACKIAYEPHGGGRRPGESDGVHRRVARAAADGSGRRFVEGHGSMGRSVGSSGGDEFPWRNSVHRLSTAETCMTGLGRRHLPVEAGRPDGPRLACEGEL